MFKTLVTGLAVSISALVLSAAPASAAHTGFALGSGGTTLMSFSPSDPAGATEVNLSGDAARLTAIDFRPATGELIGYDSATDAFYLIDPFTGGLTEISDGMTVATQGGINDIDWNPTIDRLRLVTGADQNIVFNPNDGSTVQVTDLFFGAGDANAGEDPSILGNAYTNSFAGAMTTLQYVIDTETHSLGTLANNAGTITTIGALMFEGSAYSFGNNGGFDIFFSGETQENIAYALLTSGGLTSLFIVDLATGGLTKVGDFANNFGRITGLAFGVVGAVPIPAALPLFLAGLAGLGFARRGRKKAV